MRNTWTLEKGDSGQYYGIERKNDKGEEIGIIVCQSAAQRMGIDTRLCNAPNKIKLKVTRTKHKGSRRIRVGWNHLQMRTFWTFQPNGETLNPLWPSTEGWALEHFPELKDLQIHTYYISLTAVEDK